MIVVTYYKAVDGWMVNVDLCYIVIYNKRFQLVPCLLYLTSKCNIITKD